ncbi:MAG: hypothetical protein PHG60_00865 [Candidatus Dojkabacteria bacterium]|nr:hypothetical protein [Candidatus Dojkabacteria bacterium]
MKYVIVILVILFIGIILFRKESDDTVDNFDYGYSYASENNIDSFEGCQDVFDVGDAEDGCNEYVKDNYVGYETFHGYECDEDCSGHEAGYNWAEEKGISAKESCTGKSESFIEGCETYVEENY